MPEKSAGWRYPIRSHLNSYNFNRENVYKYFCDYEAKNGVVSKKPVPTPQPQAEPVIIGNDVWIGSNVTISGGVKVGDGAVIASNSVVTKDVDSYSIIAGVPALHRKWRFPKEIVKELLAIKWWEYELGDMYKSELDFSNPANFIYNFESERKNLRKSQASLVPMLAYSVLGDNFSLSENLITDYHGNVLYVDVHAKRIIKSRFEATAQKPTLQVKNIGECRRLYAEGLGFVDLNADFEIIPKAPSENFMVSVRMEGKCNFAIVFGNQYLSSQRTGLFSLQHSPREWEMYTLPLWHLFS